MARKKQEEEKIEGGWINTFADLMNLLLCFFVLLFSMSTVDADKFEQLVTSMSERINIFSGGGSAVGEGPFVSSGTDQLVSISQFFNEFKNTGEDSKATQDQDTQKDGDQKTDDGRNQGSEGTEGQDTGMTAEQKAAYEEAEQEELKQRTQEMYGRIVEEAEKNNVQDEISINMDKNYQYVQISMNGAILFDSGTAEIKKSTLPLLKKVGTILKVYDSHMVKIVGHTDSVPISGGMYRNNVQLSMARAESVFDYMRVNKFLKPGNMEPSGRGPYEKIASNETAEGRARNRRVEIKIYTDE